MIYNKCGARQLQVMRGYPLPHAHGARTPEDYYNNRTMSFFSRKTVMQHHSPTSYVSGINTADLYSFITTAEAFVSGTDGSLVIPGSIKEDGLSIAPSLIAKDDKIYGLRLPLLVHLDGMIVTDSEHHSLSHANTTDTEKVIDFVKDIGGFVTDASEIFISSLRGNVQRSVGTNYTARKGDWESVRTHHNNTCKALMTCGTCLQSLLRASVNQVPVHQSASDWPKICDRFCEQCASTRTVCPPCLLKGHTHHQTAQRRCSACTDAGLQCIAFIPVLSAGDSVSKQQSFRQHLNSSTSRVIGGLSSSDALIPIPVVGISDACHDAKLLRNAACSWWVFLEEHLVTIRLLAIFIGDPSVSEPLRNLSKETMRMRDMMNLRSLNDVAGLANHLPQGYMLVAAVPELQTFWESNQPGLSIDIGHTITLCDFFAHSPLGSQWLLLTRLDPSLCNCTVRRMFFI